MRPVKAGWLIFLTLLSFGLGTGYYLYSRQAVRLERHAANMREIKELQKKQAKLMVVPAKNEEEGEVLKLLATKKGDLWFMEDIEEQLGTNFPPTFLMIGPLKRKDKKNHIRFSRQLSLETSFPDLINLLDILETKRGFTVSQLQITPNLGKAGRHRVNFWLSCLQIKESFLSQLGLDNPSNYRGTTAVASLLLDPPWQPGQKIKLAGKLSDPFKKFVPKKPVPVKKKLAKKTKQPKKPNVLPPIDLVGKYTLQGVVKLGGKQMVLIAPDHVLEEGDWLGEKQLVKIEKGKVTLKQGKQKYFLTLPGSVEPKSRPSPTQTKDKEASQPVGSSKLSAAVEVIDN